MSEQTVQLLNAFDALPSSRSSLLKPRSLERYFRTTSPSKTSTFAPKARNCCSSNRAALLLPAEFPERDASMRLRQRGQTLFRIIMSSAPNGWALNLGGESVVSLKALADLLVEVNGGGEYLVLRLGEC